MMLDRNVLDTGNNKNNCSVFLSFRVKLLYGYRELRLVR